jgi:hypothetical protein
MKKINDNHFLLKPFSRRELLKSFLTAGGTIGGDSLIGEIRSYQLIYPG